MWDNKYTCPNCFETRNPQELLRSKKDTIAPPWVRGSEVKGTDSNIVFPLSAEDNIITVEDSAIFPPVFPFSCNIVGDIGEELVHVVGKSGNNFFVVRGVLDTPKAFP